MKRHNLIRSNRNLSTKPVEVSKKYRLDVQMYESEFVVLGLFKFYQYIVRCTPTTKVYNKRVKFERDINGEFAWFRTWFKLPKAKYLERPKPMQNIKLTNEEFKNKYNRNKWLIPENYTL